VASCWTFGPILVTLRSWKRVRSDSGPTPRRAKAISYQLIFENNEEKRLL
jgi:hypothetical protein